MQPSNDKPSLTNTLCAQPWVGLQIRPDKGLRPCCMFPYDISSFESSDSLNHYHTSPALIKIRQKMLSGELPGECSGCQREEALTGTSPRIFSPGFSQSMETHEKSLTLNKVEFFVSNSCNLDCVMCNPVFSSKWNLLLEDLNTKNTNFLNFQPVETQRMDRSIIDSIFEQAKQAHEVLLLGGEPFASQDVLYFIERWAREECTAPLTIISNGTLLTDRTIELLSTCKNLLLVLSIDAMGPLYEWIRGYSWDKVERQILAAHQKIKRVTLSPTIAAYNIYGLRDLYHFCKAHGLRYKFDHILSQPSFLSLTSLPQDQKDALAKDFSSTHSDDFNKVIKLCQSETEDSKHSQSERFEKWCTFFNEKRKIDLFQLYPQLRI